MRWHRLLHSDSNERGFQSNLFKVITDFIKREDQFIEEIKQEILRISQFL